MNDNYSIMLIGMDAKEETAASTHLSRSGHRVITAVSFDKASERFSTEPVDIIYLNGAVDRLKEITGTNPSVPVVMVSQSPTMDFITDSWRAGAADLLPLPLTPDSLDSSLQRLSHRFASVNENQTQPMTARFF